MLEGYAKDINLRCKVSHSHLSQIQRKPTFDVNVDERMYGWKEIWTPISHPAISRCDKKESMCTINNPGHMSKMAALPICGKTLQKSPDPLDCCQPNLKLWTKYMYMYNDPVTTLTYFTVRSTPVP